MDIKIYQTFHKSFQHNSACEWIIPVGVNGFTPENGVVDSFGENISELNRYYCELTAYYWAWKNSKSDVIGFFHYRRYLNFDSQEEVDGNYSVDMNIFPDFIDHLTSEAQRDKIEKILSVSEMIIPRKSALMPSLQSQYLRFVRAEPWKAFVACLKMKYQNVLDPDVFFQNTAFAPICNIFVTRGDLFEKYCEELFLVVDTVYEQIGTPYDDYNNRYPGFLAERFLPYWIAMNRIRTTEVPMMLLG